MCGIAGILNSRPTSIEVKDALVRMQRALRHRGPDDEGMSFLPDQTGGFAHTRLSILDLSPAGHQPMSTPDGRFTITFNGEIYNYQALRSGLIALGCTFNSRSDTEVILRLYERDGARCVEKLAGMFAFAIWDAQEQTCFLARDPLGIKPLYYATSSSGLVFASELRALLASDRVPRRLSTEALRGYLLTGSVPEPLTLIEGIRVLPAGHFLLWNNGQIKLKKYWEISFRSQTFAAVGAAPLARKALLESVERHFVSDVPVSLFLSGGIDSTALVALSRQLKFRELRTFSISLDDPDLNEGDLARRTANYFRTQHVDWRLDGRAGAALLEEFLTRQDQPSIDGFNTFCVAKHARDNGAKVVLSGLGGDELFGGYSSFRRVPQMMRWSTRLEVVAPLRQAAGRLIEHTAPRSPLRRLGNFLQDTPSLEFAYQTFRGIFTPPEAAQLLKQYTGARRAAGGR